MRHQSYPMPAYLNFCPGGISYTGGSAVEDAFYNLSEYSTSSPSVNPGATSSRSSRRGNNSTQSVLSPDVLVHKAKMADDRLRQYALLCSGRDPSIPHHLPSLSALAHAAFGRLSGVSHGSAKAWADSMVLQYFDPLAEDIPESEEDIYNAKPTAMKRVTESTAAFLKRYLEEQEAIRDNQCLASPSFRPRPCGYVFKRGDIAWNCRTCQTDSTCVICDNCFRNSNHEGHEVYFHRTSPGGCCDCGDPEAWRVEGCCDTHRPNESSQIDTNADDPWEAVNMAKKARTEATETLTADATALPPRLAAALGVVIGAAVECLIQAVDGAGIGADPVQWKLRWADEATRLMNGTCYNEDYSFQTATVTPTSFVSNMVPQSFPNGYHLYLRLHNDDVHTFDEVIDALHEPTQPRGSSTAGEEQQNQSLVPLRDSATELTHHVDADGQVTVKSYSTISGALQGFRRLKSHGLHCAVISSAQLHLEQRARTLASWLSEISAAHPGAAALVVHALVQVNPHDDLASIGVWTECRMIPGWAAMDQLDDVQACRRRFNAFPPHLASSYMTREESELLHDMGMSLNGSAFLELTGADPGFYSNVPYRLSPSRYRKSPHALWGTLPSVYADPSPPTAKHPLLNRLVTGKLDVRIKNTLTETVHIVDTDLRKQQEADRITSSMYAHKLPGLHMISGVGTIRSHAVGGDRAPLVPSPMEWRHLLATSSFRAPASPVLLLLLLDPYPTKQLRAGIHALFLSLLTDARFKCRFAAALGVSYRSLSTLFCAGVGTEADTPLGFTVQIFTAGSLVRALGNASVAEKLLVSDEEEEQSKREASIGVFTLPIAHTIVRCIHTNILGATKEVNMILKNTATGNDNESQEEMAQSGNDSLLPALTYVAGEHPLMTLLPAGPDDGFLDSRSTRHKRLPHLLRDLEYVVETPGTALRLLLPQKFPVHQGPSLSSRGEDVLNFSAVFARMLRVAQGMDAQKRKIAGGHVEYEQTRWLEAFGLSLNFAGTRDALAESPTSTVSSTGGSDSIHLSNIREAMGNLMSALLRELKFWLYREGMLKTGLPAPPSGAHGGAMDLSQVEALQRSTLHVSGSQLSMQSLTGSADLGSAGTSSISNMALSCAVGVKMTEAQLNLIENALRAESAQRLVMASSHDNLQSHTQLSCPVIGDWLRVPHSPLAGDFLSFHLPIHRALAKSVRSMCSVLVPESERVSSPRGWWKLPVLDEVHASVSPTDPHPLIPLIRSTLKTSNCRVVWASGPDCTPQEAQRRRARARNVSANIAVAKIIHSLADHPIRCLAAAQQIERHLWARNGSSTAGMALNYASTPLCRSFRDLDMTLVQLSAAGMSVGLGARRVFALLISRFSMDGYLCDPERRVQGGSTSPSSSSGSYASGSSIWVNPPRLQDPDHAVVLSEAFFTTLCVVVTELPPPPPKSLDDDSGLRQSIRRELVHALAAEPRSHSEAMFAASCAVSRRNENEGGASSGGGSMFQVTFADVLKGIGKQKNQGSSRVASGPPAFELKAECCDEYDPTFFHLRRQEHQHAMDVVARLRKQKWSSKEAAEAHCLPLVCAPPKAHPRFLPCRLLLHLQAMDASIRRSLLFALTGGSWHPPSEPRPDKSMDDAASDQGSASNISASMSTSPNNETTSSQGGRRFLSSAGSSSFLKRSLSDADSLPPFSGSVVAASSVSFLEVLQLLTLQVHTLEDCAALHRTQPDLDDEAKGLSSGLSINSYLGRLAHVPESLVDVWALRPYPDGPLKSSGSGQLRGSILGLLIALYEHRSDHGSSSEVGGGKDDDGHGGARTLASSGLKWLLRFVAALVEGAPSVSIAVKSATTGVPFKPPISPTPTPNAPGTFWTIDEHLRTTIREMLANLPEMWPEVREKVVANEKLGTEKSREARKAAQQRVMEKMKRKQAAFAATIAPAERTGSKIEDTGDEADLCIICRCDDADGENNGPLGYLGHVQRSRVAHLRALNEGQRMLSENVGSNYLLQKYRVVGHMGCQLRDTDAMDSKALACLPRGSIVTVLRSTVSDKYDILSRRVLVRHVTNDPETNEEVVTEGWASVQSSQGYVILSPLASVCYGYSKWGSTRPIIRQCGHAAHLKCVERHTLSIHQRAAGEQPYDGRFAANIDDGEFLCPLCKQLSNILIPRDMYATVCTTAKETEIDATKSKKRAADGTTAQKDDKSSLVGSSDGFLQSTRMLLTNDRWLAKFLDERGPGYEGAREALSVFGAHLLQSMEVPWERTGARRRKQRHWHPAILRWDYEEGEDMELNGTSESSQNVLRLLRQQHIAWAAVGHSASALESSSRAVEEVLPFGVMSRTSDPWVDFSKEKERHPMMLELMRTLTGASGLLEVLMLTMGEKLEEGSSRISGPSVVGTCLAGLMEGKSWFLRVSALKSSDQTPGEDVIMWSQLTALMSSIPCHVARDGQLSQRCEARATAAAMWVVRGVGTQQNTKGEPPVPMAINQLSLSPPIMFSGFPADWGTLRPFKANAGDDNSEPPPFRPGVASSFLYTPMLAWDLQNFAGAVLSAVLINEPEDLPTSTDILNIARLLMTARLVQAIVTPGGVVLPDDMEVDDVEEYWTSEGVEKEGSSLSTLMENCRQKVTTKSLSTEMEPANITTFGFSSRSLLAGVGQGIVPFARSLVLMLRACVAVIRDRQRRNGLSVSATEDDQVLDSVLHSRDVMSTEDGFVVMKKMNGPLPSSLIDPRDAWWSLIDRWLIAVIGWEMHHGSQGNSVFSDPESNPMEIAKHPGDVGLVGSDINGATLPASKSQVGSEGVARMPTAVVVDEDDSSEDEAGMDIDESENHADGFNVFFNRVDQAHGVDSDEDISDEMDVDPAEDLVDGLPALVFPPLPELPFGRQAGGNTGAGDSSEEPSSSGSEGENRTADREFANLARTPIISYQPSLLGLAGIGAVRQGTYFDFAKAKLVMSDLSHLGALHRKDVPTFCLVRLPKSFVELYSIVNKVKGRDDNALLDDNDDVGSSETAICLLTGAVMRSGSPRRGYPRSARPPGACSLHARKTGSGIGVFFLVQKCTVLLMHNNKSAYSASLYVDEHGEEDPGLRRGRPLFLNEARYRALENLWRQQGIPREVAQIRSTSDRVIRDSWY